jgi:hypothetical protein
MIRSISPLSSTSCERQRSQDRQKTIDGAITTS